MFDPTAFDNMKVVLEGAVYDQDLQGRILVIDRKDLIDLARLSRKYSILFENRNGNSACRAMLTAEYGIDHYLAETRGTEQGAMAGVEMKVKFFVEHPDEQRIYLQLQHVIETIWGAGRTVEQEAAFSPFSDRRIVKNVISVSFNRLLLEEQIENIPDLVEYSVRSLNTIEKRFRSS